MRIMILFYFRCKYNCRKRAFVEETLELKLVGGFTSISVVWTISPDINWTRDSGSGNNGRLLYIYGNVLQPGIVYNFTATGEPHLYFLKY